ncbi:hypothetical protein LTR37_011041 [Vermiconidia calcicola]|uniref:Uncharacterized protein n=1 Tax=Vermiconidia calcicola TaxID=1690605 RepID=A0ACC3N3K2_9PEZI|nr:hypothetical protein LTR37_011041 [Vermiconidia calcicola]
MPVKNGSTCVALQTSFRDTAETVFNAHKRHAALETNLELLRHGLNIGEFGKLSLKVALAEAARNATSVRTFLDSCLTSFPLATLPTSQSALKAHEVLTTAELFENILAHLDPRDVLNALQLNKATSQLFINSPKLQDKLHLRPSKEEHVDSVFENPRDGRQTFPLFRLHFGESSCDGPPPVEAGPDEIVVVAEFFHWYSLPTIGSRCRAMLVCQPPVKELLITLACCLPAGPGYRLHASFNPLTPSRPTLSQVDEEEFDGYKIRSETGITVGQVYDATKQLQEEHRYCPHAIIELHNADGTVNVRTALHGKVPLKRDDP